MTYPQCITFTGIDERTDLRRLHDIAQRYEFAEFGILVSRHNAENGNRYPDVASLLQAIPDDGAVQLSAHICGGLMRQVFEQGSFDCMTKPTGNQFRRFRRCQLNTAGTDYPLQRQLHTPRHLAQVIIQQKSTSRDDYFASLIHQAYHACPLSILIDDSGGEGREARQWQVPEQFRLVRHLGFAGGINPQNVAIVLTQLMRQPMPQEWWIDMESGVRTDDWLDLDKVEQVCQTFESLMIDDNK